jgi:exonuclease SbcC
VIPQRIKLSGFLCYKEEQIIDFQGSATLWMLSGLNGSGKSAIFDAVTYALFGHHRGGASGNAELINKESNQLSVEFDFLLNGHLCRIKRTQKRDNKGGSKSTQQIFHLVEGEFQPIPDTTNKRDFDAWIAANIGLNYETFTSSVLLLQGKAEKLLDSRPEGRREVLASIVHLERYERLHARADDRRKAIEAEVKTLNSRLAAIAEVDPLELGRVRLLIDRCQEQRVAARAELERLQTLRHQAVLWRDLQARLQQSRQRYQKALAMLADAATIEKSVERLRELRQVCPLMEQISIHRAQLGQAQQKMDKLRQQREQRKLTLAEREAALRRADESRRVQQHLLQQHQAQLTQCLARLTQLASQMQTLQIVERFERELSEVQQRLAAIPADLEARVVSSRETFRRLDEQTRLLPSLERFFRYRQELRLTQDRIADYQHELQRLHQEGKALAQSVEQANERLKHAEATKAQAAEHDTEARTHYRQAKAELDELSQIDGARVCRQCGQPLSAQHLEAEKSRRGNRLREAEEIGRRCKAQLEQANEAWKRAKLAWEQLTQQHEQTREAYRSQRDALQNAERERTRLRQECASLYRDLPPEVAARIACEPLDDWTQSVWPSAADLEGLRVEVHALDKARRDLEQAEKLLRERQALLSEQESVLDRLQPYRAALPADRAALRSEHSRFQSEQHLFHQQVDAARAAIDTAEREVAKLQRERDEAQAELHRTEGDLRNEELLQNNARREIHRLTRELPETWRPLAESSGLAAISQWQGELRALENEGTEERGRELDYYRSHVDTIHQEVIDLERQQHNYPEEARQPEANLIAQWREAQNQQDRLDEELRSAQQELALLEDRHRQRQAIVAELKSLEGKLQIARTLAELLGRERLQLFLVRQAERQVVEYANAVLDRLSGGQLYLKLSGEADGEGTSSKALALEAYNRATGERPINVAFLSGSQKFRVAVSLALAIGQYASVQQRPIESVIIDEGFGCLDTQGRQVMIQELQNLRSQMKCILLVSHQEEFAEAFTDGYQFRLENGATRVSRFQR